MSIKSMLIEKALRLWNRFNKTLLQRKRTDGWEGSRRVLHTSAKLSVKPQFADRSAAQWIQIFDPVFKGWKEILKLGLHQNFTQHVKWMIKHKMLLRCSVRKKYGWLKCRKYPKMPSFPWIDRFSAHTLLGIQLPIALQFQLVPWNTPTPWGMVCVEFDIVFSNSILIFGDAFFCLD